MRPLFALLFWLISGFGLLAEALPRDAIEAFIGPPYALGEPVNDQGVWTLLNSGGTEAGFVFETAAMAPLPGFSGAPINLLVMLDRDGRFIDVRLMSHNEPIFVSGLGEAPFRRFLEQYRGQSINTPMVVGTSYGSAGGEGGLVYLDGVVKATASVRIAHESILAATLQVAREKMHGVQSTPPAHPTPDHDESLDWQALVDQGIARNLRVTNAQVDAAFAGTIWADDDPQAAAEPEGVFLDLWLVDIGPPAIARAVLPPDAVAELQHFLSVSQSDEPFLIIDGGRHGLVSENFVRNTAPDLLGATQDGLPLALRDADLVFTTLPGVPEGAAMILRTDRRLGFDPARDWEFEVKALRAHGMFQPETALASFTLTHATPERFFTRATRATPLPPWREALRNRAFDLILLALTLPALLLALGPGMNRLADHRHFTLIRLGILGFVTGYIGWWAQAQLSIVTPLAVLRSALDGGSMAYLLYDPVSALIWVFAIFGLVLWGRGLFCGWLCPFGALQEFAHVIGRRLRLPRLELSTRWDTRLKPVKYLLLSGLVLAVFLAPDHIDTMVEVEPFKTAITTFFIRDAVFVAYAAFWLVLGLFSFKGFCRYVCPLGALMAIGGLLHCRDWIARRAECGTPCQLCRVTCSYGAIKPTGNIIYSECFQCLDCVTLHNDRTRCVPLILAAKGRRAAKAKAA